VEGRKKERKKKTMRVPRGDTHLTIAHALRVRRVKKSKWKEEERKKEE